MKTPKQIIGGRAEEFVSSYLQDKGLELVLANYFCKLGEIDLIMLDNNVFVFVEVRYRRSTGFASAIDSIGKNKQRRIIRAATFYMQKNKIYNKAACRFDVVAISGELQKSNLSWIKNAFC